MVGMAIRAEWQKVFRFVVSIAGNVVEMMDFQGQNRMATWIAALIACLLQDEPSGCNGNVVALFCQGEIPY